MVTANKGRVTVVNVWASWCDPCREEMPSLVKLRQKYREKGLDLILVSADDIEKRDSLVPSVLRQLGVDFDSFIDRDSTDEQFITGMNADWSGALPTTFVYDTSGNLFKMMVGGKSYDAFEKVILSMLKPGE